MVPTQLSRILATGHIPYLIICIWVLVLLNNLISGVGQMCGCSSYGLEQAFLVWTEDMPLCMESSVIRPVPRLLDLGTLGVWKSQE